MATYFNPPPTLAGLPEIQLKKLHSYLYNMAEKLNVALEQVERMQSDDTTATADRRVDEKISAQAGDLKSLIVKTGDAVRAEMNAIVTSLSAQYVAQSEFGTFQESLQTTIRDTAASTIAEYGFQSAIDAAQSDIAEFQDYVVNSNQYIKTGLLYYAEDLTPVIGVAVGEKLTTVTVDGETLLTRSDLCATFVSDRLSFWQGGVEIAYVSNAKLYITNAEITNRLTLGRWELSHTNGFTIKWIGGV